MPTALAAVYCAITAVLPATHRRVVHNILAEALDEGLLTGKARALIEGLVDASPPPRRKRAVRR